MFTSKSRIILTLCLSLVWAAPCLGEVALVKAETLSLRSEPRTSAKRLQTLRTYEPVKVQRRRGEWAKVQAASGKEGWVLTRSKSGKRYLSSRSFVSVDNDKLNVRQGPGTNYDVLFRVERHYPLRVVQRSASGWLRVMDYDGDQGWVSSKLVKHCEHVIANLEICRIRKAPGTQNPILFTAQRGVIFRVLKERDGWLHVKHADGDDGWMSANIVFGWKDVPLPKDG